MTSPSGRRLARHRARARPSLAAGASSSSRLPGPGRRRAGEHRDRVARAALSRDGRRSTGRRVGAGHPRPRRRLARGPVGVQRRARRARGRRPSVPDRRRRRPRDRRDAGRLRGRRPRRHALRGRRARRPRSADDGSRALRRAADRWARPRNGGCQRPRQVSPSERRALEGVSPAARLAGRARAGRPALRSGDAAVEAASRAGSGCG